MPQLTHSVRLTQSLLATSFSVYKTADKAKAQLNRLPQKLAFPFQKHAGVTPEPDKPFQQDPMMFPASS